MIEESFWPKCFVIAVNPIKSRDCPNMQGTIFDGNLVPIHVITALEMLFFIQVQVLKLVLEDLWDLFLGQAGKLECKSKNFVECLTYFFVVMTTGCERDKELPWINHSQLGFSLQLDLSQVKLDFLNGQSIELVWIAEHRWRGRKDCARWLLLVKMLIWLLG